MVRRIDIGSSIAAAGAALLLVSLFLDWFDGLTGWTTFEALDLVLAALALAALLPLTRRFHGVGSVSDRHLPVIGAVTVVIVVAALVNRPPAAAGESPDTGVWLALAGAILILAGGLLGTARLALSISISDSRARRDTGETARTTYVPREPGD
jgi:peptidoglycan/LPS O-acetylase OafA/YrhL